MFIEVCIIFNDFFVSFLIQDNNCRMVQCIKLYFVLVYLREPEVMSLNFAEEPPGRSPHSIRKNSKNSPLVSFPSAWQMNTKTRCICNVFNKRTKLIIYGPRRQLISPVCYQEYSKSYGWFEWKWLQYWWMVQFRCDNLLELIKFWIQEYVEKIFSIVREDKIWTLASYLYK